MGRWIQLTDSETETTLRFWVETVEEFDPLGNRWVPCEEPIEGQFDAIVTAPDIEDESDDEF